MAPRLSKSQHDQILSMIIRGCENKEISEAIPCTLRAIRRARSSYERFGTTTMPSNRTGPDPKITPSMQMALCRQLAEDPDMDRREMADFIRDKFSVDVPLKVMRRVAEQ